MQKYLKTLVAVFCTTLLCCSYTYADVRLPKLISNGMVLQRDQTLKLWGWALPGEKVVIKFTGKTYRATAGTDSGWQVLVKPIAAGGPYTMSIAGNNRIELTDILAGDVWFCSGQSNMEMPVNDISERYANEIAKNQNAMIRQFLVPKNITEATKIHNDFNGGKWLPCTGNEVLHFSAAAYFFANSIYNREHVPIGIINASWGGTPIEAWLSTESFKAFPAIAKQVERLSDTVYVNAMQRNNNEARKAEAERTNKQFDEGLNSNPKWYEASYQPNNWKNFMLPGYWNGQGLTGFNGVIWFRKEIDVPANMTGKASKLYLGRMVDANDVYINGKLVGSTYSLYAQRRYALKPDVLLPGKNTIVIRLSNSSGTGGFVPHKPYCITAVNDTIDLSGKWQYKVGQAFEAPKKTFESYIPFYQPAVLYNTMVAPAANYKIKGALWYQGESNTSRAKEYEQLLPELIKCWRSTWGINNLYFINVQLPDYGEAKYLPVESQWAELREAERKALAVPNTAMAVTYDLGEWNDIHPQNKKDVGERLALAAERLAYGNTKIVSSGPVLQNAKTEPGKIIIAFSNTGSGLIAKGDGKLKYFAIAGADRHFVWATAQINGDLVIVSSAEITNPQFVRYAWADNPDGANLYNKDGLPASPFEVEATNNLK